MESQTAILDLFFEVHHLMRHKPNGKCRGTNIHRFCRNQAGKDFQDLNDSDANVKYLKIPLRETTTRMNIMHHTFFFLIYTSF